MEKVFKLFESQKESISKLPKKEQKEIVYSMYDYFFNNKEPAFEEGSISDCLWPVLKHSIDIQIRDRDNGAKEPKEGNRKRGRPKKETNYWEEDNEDIEKCFDNGNKK